MALLKKERTYSRYTANALVLLGKLIHLARKERKISEIDLADRIRVARSTLQRIEKGDPKCEIGFVFEAASIVGIKLFDANSRSITMQSDWADDKIALLPKAIHKSKVRVDDDF